MKDLCKAMGIEWHELTVAHYPLRIECSCGKRGFTLDTENHQNPSPTDEAFLWKALQYMMGREDWGKFLNHAAEEFYLFQVDWSLGDFMRWLLDPARFIGLCDEWCREHGGGNASV